MIEIVFNDSAFRGLQIAKNYGKGEYHGGGICVLFTHEDGRQPSKEEVEEAERVAEERARHSWECATPMGGNPGDVYGFHLGLSVGDISEDIPGDQRQEVLEHVSVIWPNEARNQIALAIQRTTSNLQTIKTRIANGEDIRIWYSNEPDEMCGLYWLMDQLALGENYCGQVYLIALPEWASYEGSDTIRKARWGELDAGEFKGYLFLQKAVTPAYCQSCASHWRMLQKENAPLRAVLNGKLLSVPESIYDAFIIRELEEEEEQFHEGRLIYRIFFKYQLGIGDSWLALRIENMIREGKLEAVTEPIAGNPSYDRLLRKCKKGF